MPSLRRHIHLFAACAFLLALVTPTTAGAQAPAGGVAAVGLTGGAAPEVAPTPAPVAGRATLAGGRAVAPPGAPPQVVAAIEAANRISGKPYRYGGGHRVLEDTGYDCSGAISYALAGARLLKTPLDSSSFLSWGALGRGRWITVYTNPGHAFVVIAGLRFDTSVGERATRVRLPGRGPRWGGSRSPRGFVARHPVGL